MRSHILYLQVFCYVLRYIYEGGRKYPVNLITMVFFELPLEKGEMSLKTISKQFLSENNQYLSSFNDLLMIF